MAVSIRVFLPWPDIAPPDLNIKIVSKCNRIMVVCRLHLLYYHLQIEFAIYCQLSDFGHRYRQILLASPSQYSCLMAKSCDNGHRGLAISNVCGSIPL